MKIAGVAAAFPDRKVSNEQVIDLIKQKTSRFEGDLKQALRKVALTLKYIGVKERRWMSEKDYSFDYIEQAVNTALDRAGLNKQSVDLLIFASVDKRLLEPGQSFFVAKAMGMKCECFDLTEGCGGWVRATHICQSYLKTGVYKNVLLVTAEFAAHENQALSFNYELRREEDLEWAFAAFSVGEGATATVLTGEGDSWIYDNRTMPEWCTHCVAPVWGDDDHVMKYGESSMAGKGMYRFFSASRLMHELSIGIVQDMIEENPVPVEDLRIFIPHTQSLSGWKEIQRNLNKDIPYTYLLPEYGNLVNNSMPAGIALAYESENLNRGDKVAGLMTAAGMSFTSYNLTF